MASIKAHNLSIQFPVYNAAHRSFRGNFIKVATGGRFSSDVTNHVYINALDQINLNIQNGERVALLGHNGSGKSTLLRAIAGVYYPTGGSLEVEGSISTLIDLHQGMDAEATGWDNIILRGLAMGMSRDEINDRKNEIAEFSELGDFLDIPVRTYSSGMKLRLAFSVSTSSPRNIVLMDEWLSTGDASFSEKATLRLIDYLGKASILVIATHSEKLAMRICDRIVTLSHGKVENDSPVNNPEKDFII